MVAINTLLCVSPALTGNSKAVAMVIHLIVSGDSSIRFFL